jgi:uncharacterized protein (DUF362 family)
MSDENSNGIHRRQILKAIAAGLAVGGCSPVHDATEGKIQIPGHSAATTNPGHDATPIHLSGASPEQKAWRRTGRSSVAIIKVASYDEDIFSKIKPFVSVAAVPSLKGQRVILKPNMVEIQGDKPIWTNPAVVKAAIELADYQGAKEVIVAEGPGHMRDTEYLMNATGIGPMLKKMGIKFVDLNLDDVTSVPNPDNFSDLDPVWLPKTIVEADAVVSVPKMKTHHWVGVTCSMKNLFGTFPGRKYGWPKNVLHIKGIPNCIIDINHLVKPKFALVDAIVAMEGDGPINGTGIDTGYLVLGCDLAAIDATCARAMGYVPETMAYLTRAGQVIGNISPDQIDLHGATLEEITRDFKKPITFYNHELLAESSKSGS